MSDIVERLRGGVDADIGVYPKAVSGYNDERDYEQRDGFKNGWNAAVLQIEGAYEVLLGDAATEIENLRRELDITHNMVRNHKERVAELEVAAKALAAVDAIDVVGSLDYNERAHHINEAREGGE